MTAKTSGAEFKQFYNDKAFWPEDAWHEDSVILVDGKPHEDLSDNQIADSAKVVIDSGHVFFSREDSAGVSMATFFNRWRKVQNMRSNLLVAHTHKIFPCSYAMTRPGRISR